MVIKQSIGKLSLPVPADELCRQLDFDVLALTGPHSQRMSTLPLLHRDPFDRLLIAQSLEDGLTLITSDQAIWQYAGVSRCSRTNSARGCLLIQAGRISDSRVTRTRTRPGISLAKRAAMGSDLYVIRPAWTVGSSSSRISGRSTRCCSSLDSLLGSRLRPMPRRAGPFPSSARDRALAGVTHAEKVAAAAP